MTASRVEGASPGRGEVTSPLTAEFFRTSFSSPPAELGVCCPPELNGAIGREEVYGCFGGLLTVDRGSWRSSSPPVSKSITLPVVSITRVKPNSD